MAIDTKIPSIAAIEANLNASKIASTNNPLYQSILSLINSTKGINGILDKVVAQLNTNTATITSKPSTNTLLSGRPLGMDGLDGVDGMDAITIVGASGGIGPQGPQGIAGIIGMPGRDGYDGEDGLQGMPGSIGLQGIPGISGTSGYGIDGIDGIDGLDGMNIPVPGAQGSQGLAGINGNQGIDGIDGVDGIDGFPGAQGLIGLTGNAGISGFHIDGQDGLDGMDGLHVPNPGPMGPQGIQGIAGSGGVIMTYDDDEPPIIPANIAYTNLPNIFQASQTLLGINAVALNFNLGISQILQILASSGGVSFVVMGELVINSSSGGILIGSVGTPLDNNSLYVQSNINAATFGTTGTFTPTDASGASLTFTGVIATYMKIGKLVFFSLQLSYPVTASAAITLIGGLPFTEGSGSNTAINVGYQSSTTFLFALRGIVNGSATTISPNYNASTGLVTNPTNAQLSNGTYIFSGLYRSA
jgi:hypothetical protein